MQTRSKPKFKPTYHKTLLGTLPAFCPLETRNSSFFFAQVQQIQVGFAPWWSTAYQHGGSRLLVKQSGAVVDKVRFARPQPPPPSLVTATQREAKLKCLRGGGGVQLRLAGLTGITPRQRVNSQTKTRGCRYQSLSKKDLETALHVQCRTSVCPQWHPTVPQSTMPTTATQA